MRLEILSQTVVPNKCTIQRLVERFRETRNVGEKRRSGRLSALSNDSLEDIRARLLQSPRKSLRKFSQQTVMTYGSVQRVTKRLKLHSYRVLLPLLPPFGSLCMRCYVLTAASVNMAAFWKEALCSLVEADRRFRCAFCLRHHRPDDVGNTQLRNVFHVLEQLK
jgi:hypothetical protein